VKCLSVIIGDFYTFYRFYLCRYFGVDVEVLCRVYICFEFHFYIRDFQSGYIGYFTGLGFETSCIRLKVGSEVVYHDGIDSVDIFGNIIRFVNYVFSVDDMENVPFFNHTAEPYRVGFADGQTQITSYTDFQIDVFV